ncbi:MAG: hypothetical protein Tsb0034_21640 [Ekhidna sp.]
MEQILPLKRTWVIQYAADIQIKKWPDQKRSRKGEVKEKKMIQYPYGTNQILMNEHNGIAHQQQNEVEVRDRFPLFPKKAHRKKNGLNNAHCNEKCD